MQRRSSTGARRAKASRREFLRAAGLALGAGAAGGTAALGACTSGGGDQSADGGGRSGRGAPDGGSPPAAGEARASLGFPLSTVGVQLYTLRSPMADDVAATLDAVAAIGYREAEFAGYFGHDPAAIRSWLDASGLSAPAAHVGWEELDDERLPATVDAAAALGHRWLVLPWIAEAMRTADGYRAAADRLNEVGLAARPAGIRAAYHNHAFEFEPLAGSSGAPGQGVAGSASAGDAGSAALPAAAALDGTGFAILAERLDPEFADLEVDLHWSAAAGVDPFDLLAAHPGRFALAHLKDIDLEGRMLDVGAGVIDWPAILARSGQAGLRHCFVEHDNPADPLASVQASYDYLTGREPG